MKTLPELRRVLFLVVVLLLRRGGLGWLLLGLAASFELLLQLVGGGDDRHTCAMVGERPQDMLAVELLETRCELCLGEGEGVTKMKFSVHVWVREGGEESLAALGILGVGLVRVAIVP